MRDFYNIDGHKLMYHVDRLAKWQKGELVYPIYMEISPVGMCNHRCTFCSVDFMGYKNISLDTCKMKYLLAELGKLGLKSIMYAGEGEPLLHKDIAQIVEMTRHAGIDIAFTTNGVFLENLQMEDTLDKISWIKVSCNAGTAETYAALHRTKITDFSKVFENLESAVKIRNKLNSKCTLGIQILLLPENSNEVYELGKKSFEVGLDYMVVKPYTHHYRNKHNIDINYKKYAQINKQIDSLRNQGFQVVFREDSMCAWDSANRTYDRCLGLPFWSYLDAKGNVWGCSAHLDDERFFYGNIYKESFEEIWTGDKRKKSLAWSENVYDLSKCKINCRMDKINQYLWELQNKPHHLNFI